MNKPKFKTAIPKRRYELGDFHLVVLGDVESDEPPYYTYVLAAVPQGKSEPTLYVTSERVSRAERQRGSHRMRLVTTTQDVVLDIADPWSDLERFTTQALKVTASALGTSDAEPYRLM